MLRLWNSHASSAGWEHQDSWSCQFKMPRLRAPFRSASTSKRYPAGPLYRSHSRERCVCPYKSWSSESQNTWEDSSSCTRCHRCSRKLAKILNEVCSENSIVAWERLFLFGRRCLQVPARGGHRRNLASFVQRAVAVEKDSELDIQHKVKPTGDPLRNLAAKLEEGDFRGAVRIASSNECFAPTNDATLQLLKEKHPCQHPNCAMPQGPDQPSTLEVSPSDVISAIQSFPAGSAGGPDGLRPQHLKDLI